MGEQVTSLAQIIKEVGLDKTRSKFITDNFAEYEAIAAEWRTKAQELEVTSEDQVAEMKLAREGRLFLKNKRSAIENARKELKKPSIDEGRAIDEVSKFLKGLIEPIEEDLENKEKFAERKAAERQAQKQQERMAALEPYGVAVDAAMIGSMTDAMFDSYLKGVKADYESAIEAEKKAEQERIESERKIELHRTRMSEVMSVWDFVPVDAKRMETFAEISDVDWKKLVDDSVEQKRLYEVEQEKIRQENARLKEEAEKKEREIVEKQELRLARGEELKPYIVFIRDYNKMIDLPEDDYKKEFSEIKKAAELQWKYDREEEERLEQIKNEEKSAINEKIAGFHASLQKDGYENIHGVWRKGKYSVNDDRLSSLAQHEFDERLAEVNQLIQAEAELQAKRDAEERQRLADEQTAQKEEEERLKAEKAPDKEKIIVMLNNFDFPNITVSGFTSKALVTDLRAKFESYKAWAKAQVERL